MPGIGHNSSRADEPLLSSIQPDDDASPFLYAQWHVGDFITGTLGMNLETEGAYMRFLMRLYQRGKPLPDDDRFMSTVMNLSLRVWKRIKGALIEAGKIILKGGCLTNARFEKERQKRAEQLKKLAEGQQKRRAREKKERESLPKVSAKFAESLAQVCPKLPENDAKKVNEINDFEVTHKAITYNHITNNQDSKNNRLTESELSDALEKAAGAALKNPAACPGLLVLSQPRRWLEQGCDLHLDILPTVKAVSAKRPPRSIGDWTYFTQAVSDARAARLTPMPEARPSAPARHQSFAEQDLERHRNFMREMENF